MEYYFDKLKRSFKGRLLAGVVIGGVFGASAGAGLVSDATGIVLSAAGSAFIGLLAVCLLEFRDHERRQSPEWQERLARKADEIRLAHPDLKTPAAVEAAEEHEQQRPGLLFWTGMILGGFCVLCFAGMLIYKLVQLLKLLR
jgi:hypothetical protein